MPVWLLVLLGGGLVYYLFQQGQSQAAQAFSGSNTLPGTIPTGTTPNAYQVGQVVNIANGAQMYSDTGLTQNIGQWPGGTSHVSSVDPNGVWVGFTSQSGSSTMNVYISSSSVSPSGTLV